MSCVEVVAGPLPPAPQRLRAGEHRALPREEAIVLGLEDREDELLLAPEVVVDLAERDPGGVGDARASRGSRSRRRGASRGPPRGSRRGCRRSRDRGARPGSRERSTRPSTLPEDTTPAHAATAYTAARISATPSGRVSRRPQGRFFSTAVSAPSTSIAAEAAEPDAEHDQHQRPAAADAERAVGDPHREGLALRSDSRASGS